MVATWTGYGDDGMDLHLVDDELASCVGCGLCLPHCPTFRVTGEEALSPRGRIAAMRAVQWEGAAPDRSFVHFMETCVQCRGCEPACPSGVPFGRLMEGTRDTLARHHRMTPRWQRAAFWSLGHHALVLAGSSALAVLQRLHLVPRRLGLPPLPLRRAELRSSGDDVWLFTGCVMDAWLRPTHAATLKVIEATGTGVRLPGRGADCCGALHSHAGLTRQARRLAQPRHAGVSRRRADPRQLRRLRRGAQGLRAPARYGRSPGVRGARCSTSTSGWPIGWTCCRPRPAAWLRSSSRTPATCATCNAAPRAVRAVLAHVADVVELDDDGLCCGAGGAYSALEPELAGAVRQRKLEAIERATARTGARVVASANPGCAIHLRAAGLIVRHPVNLLAQGISGEPTDQLAPALAADPAGF